MILWELLESLNLSEPQIPYLQNTLHIVDAESVVLSASPLCKLIHVVASSHSFGYSTNQILTPTGLVLVRLPSSCGVSGGDIVIFRNCSTF